MQHVRHSTRYERTHNGVIEFIYVYIYPSSDDAHLHLISNYIERNSSIDVVDRSSIIDKFVYIVFVQHCDSETEAQPIDVTSTPSTLLLLPNTICFVEISTKLYDIRATYIHKDSTSTNNRVIAFLCEQDICDTVFMDILHVLIYYGMAVSDVIAYLVYANNPYHRQLVDDCMYKYKLLIRHPCVILEAAVLTENIRVVTTICKDYNDSILFMLKCIRRRLFVNNITVFWNRFWDTILSSVNSYDIRELIRDMLIHYMTRRRLDLILRLFDINGWNRLQYSIRHGTMRDITFCLRSGDDPRVFNHGTPSPIVLTLRDVHVNTLLKNAIYYSYKYPFLCGPRFRHLLVYTMCVAKRVGKLQLELWYHIMSFYDRNDSINM